MTHEPVSRPEWLTDNYPNYDNLINSFGFKTVAEENFGSYQGDAAFILRDGNKLGWLVFGYGSCSGCDHLQSISPWCSHYDDKPCDCDWSKVVAFRDELKNDVQWSDPANADPANHWWMHDTEIKTWLHKEYAAALAGGEQR